MFREYTSYRKQYEYNKYKHPKAQAFNGHLEKKKSFWYSKKIASNWEWLGQRQYEAESWSFSNFMVNLIKPST